MSTIIRWKLVFKFRMLRQNSRRFNSAFKTYHVEIRMTFYRVHIQAARKYAQKFYTIRRQMRTKHLIVEDLLLVASIEPNKNLLCRSFTWLVLVTHVVIINNLRIKQEDNEMDPLAHLSNIK